jgi:hypothetical protein
MSNVNLSNTIPQFNPTQFGLLGLPNSGFFNGLGGIPLGGFGPAGGAVDGDFSSLYSSLQGSGTFGPGLYSNLGPPGSNPQAISLAAESANAGTSALLYKLAPLDIPPEAMYSSSVFGYLASGLSVIDTLSAFANGIAGILPLNTFASRAISSAGPVLGALSGILGIARGFKESTSAQNVDPALSTDAAEDLEIEFLDVRG